jgi:hypothetical protein
VCAAAPAPTIAAGRLTANELTDRRPLSVATLVHLAKITGLLLCRHLLHG